MTTNEDKESATSTATNPTTAKSATISSASQQSKRATSSITARQLFGQWTVQVSDAINDNLILVRYGTITSIALLSAYGLYKTPLFFRYKSVSDIPCVRFFSLILGFYTPLAIGLRLLTFAYTLFFLNFVFVYIIYSCDR